MIKMYKTIDLEGTLNEINNIEDNCWINLIAPTQEEIKSIAEKLEIDENYLNVFLDEEEQARTEVTDDIQLIVLDIPSFEKHTSYSVSVTVPLVILQVKNKYIITLCVKETDLFDDFINGKIKNFFTEKKSRFTIQIMLKVASRYIKDLKIINEETNKSEKSLKKSTNNNDLLKLMNLQKSLVYFSTSLRSNDVVLEKLQKNNLIPLYEEDMELLDDVVIENRQAIEMASIYSGILSSTIEIFGTIISNNLNKVMKFLAGFTIVISIPTMVASFMGMNVPLGFFQESTFSFLTLVIVSLILALLVAYILKKKDML
ncbi:MAG: magnesium transporter CorA family protein [Bacilli bacterium]|nr:magnesium transporter CorA family protein [Bacilli bacterium]